MAKAKTAAKKTTKKKVLAEPVRSSSRSVDIEKASNGYVVSSWNDGNKKTLIAKTREEAKKHADKLLGI